MNFGHGEGCICRECSRARKLIAECDDAIRGADRAIATLGKYRTDHLVRKSEDAIKDATARVPPWMPLGGE